MGYMSSASMLSQISIDSDLVMGAHNITLNASQTVDGKDVSFLEKVEASDDLRNSHDAAENAPSTTENTLWKRVTLANNSLKGIIRVKFTLSVVTAGKHALGRIYINGVAVGTPREQNGVGNTEWSEDLTVDLAIGDTIDIWGWVWTVVENGNLTNFRLYCKDVVPEYTND